MSCTAAVGSVESSKHVHALGAAVHAAAICSVLCGKYLTTPIERPSCQGENGN